MILRFFTSATACLASLAWAINAFGQGDLIAEPYSETLYELSSEELGLSRPFAPVEEAWLFPEEADDIHAVEHFQPVEHAHFGSTLNPDDVWDWHVLPDGVVYKSYLAAERDPRLSTAFLQESGGQLLWDSALGGRASLLRYGTFGSEMAEGWELQVEGAAFVRLLPEEERDVAAVDFRAGVPLAYRKGPFQWKLAYYHISSHLGDEFLLKRPGYDRLNYSRDALVLGTGYFPTDNLRLYFEVGYAAIYTSGGAEPWELQTGLEFQTQGPTGIQGAPYFALNIHLREEVDWGGSINLLAGWMWRGFHTDHTFRIGMQFYNGKNAQYSFLQDSQQLFGFGIRYDF